MAHSWSPAAWGSKYYDTCLATALTDAEPPSEVRLFTRGINPSRQGPVLFDERAAESVMHAYREHGVPVTIDLQHHSLDPESRSYDPDARGSGQLELRDGELWLVGIKWTADGEARIRERRQRFVSPAFKRDRKTNRVTHVHNVAICAQPATDNAMPLIAASGAASMDPKILKEALDAIEGGDSAKAMELLKALIASAAGAPSEPAEMAAAEAAKKEEEQIAASARRITGKTSPVEVEAVLTALSATRSTTTDLAAELTTLRAHMLQSDLREIVRSNPKKIASPKIEALVLASASADAARTLVDALPEVIGTTHTQREKPAETEEIRLTDEDREVAKLTGQDVGKVLEFKRKTAQR